MKTEEVTTENSQKIAQDSLTGESGLAIVLVDENSSVLSESNNNSMCRMLYNSAEFAPECAKYCGKAFEMAASAGKTVGYKCYANLNCLAVPVIADEKPSVAIVGRTFTKAEDYRAATERAIEGDWKQFSPDEFFENVLLTNSTEQLKKLAGQVEKLYQAEETAKSKFTVQNQSAANFKQPTANGNGKQKNAAHKEIASEVENSKTKTRNPKYRQWRSLFGSLLALEYRQALQSIVQFIEQQYSISNLAWLERRENRLEILFAIGDLKDREIQINISTDDEHLLEAVKNETSLELRERQNPNKTGELQMIRLFPIAVGGEIRSALVVGDEIEDDVKKRHIARFCRTVASELEILRLREELSRRSSIERAVGKINESLRNIDADDFWSTLNNVSAEIMRAERSSLLVLNKKTGAFVAKAATGIRADFIKKANGRLGERIARNVLDRGEAIVVADVNNLNNLSAAPEDWLYKSKSFISYPIQIGERKIGVLNLTDKADGDSYNNFDLELLHAIMPSLAVMIDRADLKNKAGEFEQLSVTDPLTGLLNRRYLEERITEEIRRSNRHHFPMSLMMIDVDEFKSYNDTYGHTEGDKALQIVGICLKEKLRANRKREINRRGSFRA
jgi:GAF domain-containing protein/ligand-binding sensor protein